MPPLFFKPAAHVPLWPSASWGQDGWGHDEPGSCTSLEEQERFLHPPRVLSHWRRRNRTPRAAAGVKIELTRPGATVWQGSAVILPVSLFFEGNNLFTLKCVLTFDVLWVLSVLLKPHIDFFLNINTCKSDVLTFWRPRTVRNGLTVQVSGVCVWSALVQFCGMYVWKIFVY